MDSNNTKQIEHSKKQKGFTLVEVIVAVGIFSLVMMVAIGAVLAIVSANKKAQSLHNVINSFNLSIETMVRDMRTGYDYACDGAASDCPGGGSSFSFTSTLLGDKRVTYAFESDGGVGYITKEVEGESDGPSRLTSADVEITNLSFTLTGVDKLTSSVQDFFQPKVLVIIQGQVQLSGQVSQFNLQTLVTPRRIDI